MKRRACRGRRRAEAAPSRAASSSCTCACAPPVDEFVERYHACLEEDRVFIHTRATQPAGTRVRFTLHLQSGAPLLRGRGVVQRLRDGDARTGIEIAFVPLDGDGLSLVERLRARRAAHERRSSADDSPSLPELVPESSLVPVNPLGGIVKIAGDGELVYDERGLFLFAEGGIWVTAAAD